MTTNRLIRFFMWGGFKNETERFVKRLMELTPKSERAALMKKLEKESDKK